MMTSLMTNLEVNLVVDSGKFANASSVDSQQEEVSSYESNADNGASVVHTLECASRIIDPVVLDDLHIW